MKRILSIFMAVMISYLSVAVLLKLPVSAAPERYMEFFGVRDADYFLYNGAPWLENLIFEKDEGLVSLTSDNPNRIYFSDLSNRSNDFFASHKAAYCLEANAAYPWGCTYFSDLYITESAYTREQIAGISNILKNGYPACKDYWYGRGIKSYGAQMMATQAAIWIITGRYASTTNQVSYDMDALSANYNSYSFDEIGDLKAMLEELVICGEKSDITLYEPYIDIMAEEAFYDRGEIIFSYNVRNNVLGELYLNIKDYSDDFMVLVDEQKVNYCSGMTISNSASNIKIVVPSELYAGRDMEIELSALTQCRDTENVYWYKSDDKVEKWQGSGLFTRQQVVGTKDEKESVSCTAKADAWQMPKTKVSMVIYKNDEGIGLAGATFELVNVSEIIMDGEILVPSGTVLDVKTSDTYGNVNFRDDLPAGYIYEAREISFPAGYVSCEPVVVRFDANGAAMEDITLRKEVPNTPQYGKLCLEKQGEVLVDVTYTENGMVDEFIYELRRVGGAVYGVYDDESCGEEHLLEKVTTLDDDYVFSSSYKLLDYPVLYLKELDAPVGMVLDTEVYPIVLQADETQKLAVTKVTLEDKRQKVDLSIYKYDAETMEPVSDAGFLLKNESPIVNYRGDVVLAKESSIEYVSTDKTGMAHFDCDLPVGQYCVNETAEPKGYVIFSDEIMCDATAPADSEIISICKSVPETPLVGELVLSYKEDSSSLGIGITPSVKKSRSTSPRTGDSNNTTPLIAIMTVCLCMVFALCRKKRISLLVLCVMFALIPLKTNAKEMSIESPVVYDDSGYDFDEQIESDGDIYYLKSVQRKDIADCIHVETVKETYIYEGFDSDDAIPATVKSFAKDRITGREQECVLNCTDISLLDEVWLDDFEFEITCYNVDGLYYIHDGEKYFIECEDDFHSLDDVFLAELGLRSDRYVVDSYEYTGDEYEFDGRLIRKVTAKGRRLVKNYSAEYTGEVVFTYENAVSYTGIYETAMEEVSLMPDYFEDADTDDTSDIVKMEIIKTKGMADISFLTYVMAGLILLLLFMLCLFRKRKKTK